MMFHLKTALALHRSSGVWRSSEVWTTELCSTLHLGPISKFHKARGFVPSLCAIYSYKPRPPRAVTFWTCRKPHERRWSGPLPWRPEGGSMQTPLWAPGANPCPSCPTHSCSISLLHTQRRGGGARAPRGVWLQADCDDQQVVWQLRSWADVINMRDDSRLLSKVLKSTPAR